MGNFFAKNIRFLRKERSLIQDDMQRECGITRGTWANYENTVSEPDFDKIIVISQFFGVPIDSLLLQDLSVGVHLNEKSKETEKTENVHPIVHPPVHVNTITEVENLKKQLTEKDNYIAVKEDLIRVQTEFIQTLKTTIALQQNQLDQHQFSLNEEEHSQQPRREKRKSA